MARTRCLATRLFCSPLASLWGQVIWQITEPRQVHPSSSSWEFKFTGWGLTDPQPGVGERRQGGRPWKVVKSSGFLKVLLSDCVAGVTVFLSSEMPYQSLHNHPARADHRVPRQGNTGNLDSAVYEWPTALPPAWRSTRQLSPNPPVLAGGWGRHML